MKRRRVQDIIDQYRLAKRRRYSDRVAELGAEVGQALAETGILCEPDPTGKFTTIWQPVAVEGGGGMPGFATHRFRNTSAVPAPAIRAVPQLQPA